VGKEDDDEVKSGESEDEAIKKHRREIKIQEEINDLLL